VIKLCSWISGGLLLRRGEGKGLGRERRKGGKEEGRDGRKGKEGRGRKGRGERGGNVVFHHLLLSNLTTA